ncbi:MAG: RHS repeat domain-containing protein [Terricaulis sp.]
MKFSRRTLLYSAGGLLCGAASVTPTLAFADDTAEYFYDALGRLIRVELSDGTVVAYYYDAAGNRMTVTHGDDVAFNQTIQVTGTSPVNLRTLANQSGYLGSTNATITFQVGSTVTITGLAGGPNGGVAIDTGVWPSATKSISLTLQVSGKVYGGGGVGASSGQAADNPGVGGDAIYCRENINVTVNAGGQVRGGGGGGGHGGGWENAFLNGEGQWETVYKYGGGGGGGFPNGPGGTSESSSAGSSGTSSGGGAGGAGAGGGGHPAGAGGTGGGFAGTGNTGGAATGTPGCNLSGTICWNGPDAPGTGGAPGYAIRKNGKTVNVTNNGTISGTVG